MFRFRRAHAFLNAVCLTLLLAAPGAGAEEGKEVLALSINQFASLALQNSLRSRTAKDSLTSSRWGWIATRRNLTWPRVDAAASQSKTFSDTDAGTQTDTGQTEGSLALRQPLLTGANLSVGSTWTKARTETDALGTSTPSESKTLPAVSAELTQPLFLFVGNDSLRARREANLRWTNDQDGYRGERLSIEFDARTLYYNLLLQSETAEVERKKYESANLVHDVTKALVRAGKLAEVELVRADIRANQDSRRIRNSENSLEKTMNQANDLISTPPGTALKLTSKLDYQPLHVPLERLLKAAQENNPALRQAERQVELTEISFRRTKEGDRPRLNASGTYNLTRNRSNPVAPLDPYSWSLTLGMNWPIFDATQTNLQVQQSEVALRNAKRSFETQSRQLAVSVQNAYLEMKRTEQQIAQFEPQRENAKRNVSAIRLQYRNGLTRLTDVFDAENEMRDLELEYLGLLVDFNSARDQLKVLVGTELEPLEREPGR